MLLHILLSYNKGCFKVNLFQDFLHKLNDRSALITLLSSEEFQRQLSHLTTEAGQIESLHQRNPEESQEVTDSIEEKNWPAVVGINSEPGNHSALFFDSTPSKYKVLHEFFVDASKLSNPVGM